LMIVVSVAELVSIGAVFPFLMALTSPHTVFDHSLTKPLIKILGMTEPKQLLAPMTLMFGLAALISGGLRLLLSWAQTRLSYAMGADFSFDIYKRTLYQPYKVHLTRNTSEIIAAVTSKADGIVHQAVLPVLVITSSAVILLSVIAALFAIQPMVTAVAMIGFGSIYATTVLITRRRMIANSHLISRQQILVIKVLQEALGGIRDVIINGTQRVYTKIYRDSDRQLRRAQAHIAIIAVSPRYIVEAIGMAMISSMAYVLSTRTGGLDLAIPFIGTLALAAQRMLPLLQLTYSSWTTIRGGQAGLGDALVFLNQPIPENSEEDADKKIDFNDEIVFENVGFRYDEDKAWVLRNLNLTIRKNSRIGFIGSTGSGKSTLLDIAMGLLPPSEGVIKIDGQAIDIEDYRAWQKKISHVPQSLYLSDASVAENIAFGVPWSQIDMGRVRQSAERAQIATTIEKWTGQYDTIVGERGVRLSGGQRQRIGIARALYKNAEVIVFDEATSALDWETEKAVMESINSLGGELTIIMVAHRLTTLKNCTEIVELEGGRVKSIGTYEEMVGHNSPA
jgi:ABC-type multidrug transport system fused ATPase/permease subunit